MNASDAPPLVIATSTLLVEYSVDGMKRRIAWRGGEASVIVEESEAPSGIELADVALGPMRVNTGETHRARIVDPELGPCEELLISGSATGGDATIEKVCQVRIPEAFPHVVITRTRFKNAGSAAVRIRRVESERVRLNRRLADPTAQSFEFASYHGAPRFWGTEYNLVRLQPGFFQRNLFGQHRMDDPDGSGGGMPLVDLWCKTMGVALAHIEKSPQWLSMPVRVLDDGTVSASIVEEPSVTLGQVEVLEPGQQYEAATTALIFHRGDYHDPLRTFAELLRRRGVAIPQTSPDWAYEPYWKTWGFGADFRVSEVLALLEQLRSFEIGICNLDDGWFDFAGDWNPDTSPHKFPEGDTSMESFVERLHREGMRSSLWWYPLGVHPDSQLARQHPEMLVTDETGQPALDPNKLHQLCPAYPPARQHIIRTLRRILADWGFDGVYLDWCGLSAVPACHNPHHRHERPLDAFEAVPEVFADIHREAHQIHRDPLIEVCICSYPHSPYNMPYYGLANASDPMNNEQARRRIKEQKAIHGPTFAVGDCYQVPADEWSGCSVIESFETSIGCGAQLTTFYRDLAPEQEALWRRWFLLYRKLGLARGEYLNLYDLAFDAPEGHVVRKGRTLYFAFYAPTWAKATPIELRGLEPDVVYDVEDYAREQHLCTVSGPSALLSIGFKDALLVRACPRDA